MNKHSRSLEPHLVILLLLQACAALDFRPPGWLMVPLVSALQQQLGLLTPADLAGAGSRQQCTSSSQDDMTASRSCGSAA
jgi:hypothetical protein